MSRKTKRILSIIGIVLLGALAVGGIIALVRKYDNKDEFESTWVTWSIGQLDESDGSFTELNCNSIVSNYIKFNDGIRVTINENKNAKYSLYFYDENKLYIGCKTFLDGNDYTFTNTVLTSSDVSPSTVYVRVLLFDLETEDNHIDLFEQWKFETYLKIETMRLDENK